MMKKITLLAVTLCTGVFAMAQCSQIFISEYIEGSRNNKALELYNPTDKAISLIGYRLTRWSNGSAVWSPQYSDTLSGTIAPYSTFNLVIERTDTTAKGVDTAASAILLGKADLLLSKDYNTSFSMSFNGDDALSLDIIDPNASDPSNPYMPIDIFGKIGERPRLGGSSRTIGWSDSFPHNNGQGLWYTIDKTLIRKRTVMAGISANPSSFDPSKEWVAYPRDMFDSFGMHVCNCETLSADKVEVKALSLFPNPAENNVFIPLQSDIQKLELFTMNGQSLDVTYKQSNFARMRGYTLDLSTLGVARYVVVLTDNLGVTHTAVLLKE